MSPSAPSSTHAASKMSRPLLFQPLTLREVTFRSRLIVTPMCQYCAVDGRVNDWHLGHHARFALAGVGGAFVEMTGVTPNARITPGCLGIWSDDHIPGLTQIVSIYRVRNIPIGIQIAHSGFKGSGAVPEFDESKMTQGAAQLPPGQGWTTVAPSPVVMIDGYAMPHALTDAEIHALIAAFADAAERAVVAGFDMIEIHGAHGYLVHSFFSPLSNRRNDDWGGDLERRMRFPLRIAEAVRARMPDRMPLFYRASVEDAIDGGLRISDTIALAKELKTRGVDLVDCSSGGLNGASGRAAYPQGRGYMVPYASAIRRAAAIPTMAVGLIDTPELANSIIADGNADLVAMGRGLLNDPNFPHHAAKALGHSEPYEMLPAPYAFFLKRRDALLSAPAPASPR